MSSGRLWGARFSRPPTEEVIAFLAGRDVAALRPCDEALIPADLLGNRAHVIALFEQGIIAKKDAQALLRGLHRIERLHMRGEFKLDPSKEDVHTNVESKVTEICGTEHGGKIHTGRSRNDQVALDLRLYLREAALACMDELVALGDALVEQAGNYAAEVMPGYTHHQHATFTTFGHLLLCYAHQLGRDMYRLQTWIRFYNRSPLGAAAGYGTSLATDRERVAELLGFEHAHENSLDSVTNRQEAEAHLGFTLAMIMAHLSSMAQTFLLLSTNEFGMVIIDDMYCTGSSIMPQKKNPDCLEIIKGKAALTQGRLVSLLSLAQSSFMGYNREAQLGKYVIMDLIADAVPCISIMRGIVKTVKVNSKRMAELSAKGFLGATALTEYLCAKKGLPFRRAKELVERGVAKSEEQGREEVTFEALSAASAELGISLAIDAEEVRAAQEPRSVLTKNLSQGGPSMAAVRRSSRMVAGDLTAHRVWLHDFRAGLGAALRKLESAEKKILA